MSAIRYALSGLLALAITFSLFYLMQFLISIQEKGGVASTPNPVITLARVIRDSAVEPKRLTIPKPIPKVQTPPPPVLPPGTLDDPTGEKLVIPIPIPRVEGDSGHGLDLHQRASDGDIAPLVRVEPMYPVRAQERGIEGWVIVEFTIAPDGSVKEAHVLDADPPRIFDRAALRAVDKWKYRPKIEGGKPVERPGVQVKFPFELEK